MDPCEALQLRHTKRGSDERHGINVALPLLVVAKGDRTNEIDALNEAALSLLRRLRYSQTHWVPPEGRAV